MKKMGMVLLACFAGAVFCSAQETETLGTALTNTVVYISGVLPRGTRTLILKIAAPTAELGDYVTDELSARIVNGRLFTVVERSADVMREVDRETGYQMTGEVSDETMQSIGRKTGAQTIITGSISRIGSLYRMSVKATNVERAELQGQRVSTLQADSTLSSLLGSQQAGGAQAVRVSAAGGRPDWIDEPLKYGRSKYENGGSGVSPWYYDVGVSNQAANEQRARTRARENVQANVAANIASEMKARIDVTESSLFRDSDVEDAERLIEAAFTTSIRTKVPSYETLEWYVDTGRTDKGQSYYMAYMLVRFPRNEIISVVDGIDPAKVTDSIIQQGKIPAGTATESAKTDLRNSLLEAREYAKRELQQGTSNR
jgi:hypothetical protein